MLEIGIIASCKYNDANALTSQVVLHGAGSSCTPALAYSPFGLKGRPRSGVTDSNGNYTDGAIALYWYEGWTLHSIPLDDGRRSTSGNFPVLDEGGAVFYGDTDDAFSVYDGQGNLTVSAPKAATIKVAPKGGKVAIGDNPQAIALGPALQSAINALQIFATATKAATIEPTLGPAATALSSALQTILAIQTTELTAT